MDPLLSVIIPVHDGERWLGQTLDSLVAQDDRDFECVIVDSSSAEGTAALVRSYVGRLDLRIFSRPDLAHWRAKTNFGVGQARSAHISMLHQDDFWLAGRAACARRWIEGSPGAAMHLHPSRIVDGLGRSLGTWRCPLPSGKGPVPRELLVERLLVQNFIAVPSPIIRRDAFLAVGGIDETLWYTGDWDLYLKLARMGDVVYHRPVLSAFRVHGQSMTATGSRGLADFEAQMRRVLDAHIVALPPGRRGRVLPRARSSIGVNSGLAAASNGAVSGLLRAALAVLALGPLGFYAYLRDSRLLDRVLPRLRARLAGGL